MIEYSESYRRFRNLDKDEYYLSATYFVINDLFLKRFSFAGNTNAYLTDYSENRGSLIVSFTILVVGAITNYGSIRETIDYFAEDMERLFTTSLNNYNSGYTVTSTVDEQNSLASFSSRARNNDNYNTLLAKIKVDRILIGIVFFVLILLLVQNYFVVNDNSKQDVGNDTKMRNMVIDEIRNQRIDEHLKTKADTILTKAK